MTEKDSIGETSLKKRTSEEIPDLVKFKKDKFIEFIHFTDKTHVFLGLIFPYQYELVFHVHSV